MKYPVLVLNLDMTPFDVWDWQHSISKLLCTNSVEPIYDENGMVKHDFIVRDGAGNEYDLPAVLKLTRYINAHTGKAPYTKQNIYARDLNICQYCGDLTHPGNRTIDHVIPRAKFHPRKYPFRLNSFENVVTACGSCNKRKRDRTPEQANMKLIHKPKGITRIKAYINKMSLITHKPKLWIPYISKGTNVEKV